VTVQIVLGKQLLAGPVVLGGILIQFRLFLLDPAMVDFLKVALLPQFVVS